MSGECFSGEASWLISPLKHSPSITMQMHRNLRCAEALKRSNDQTHQVNQIGPSSCFFAALADKILPNGFSQGLLERDWGKAEKFIEGFFVATAALQKHGDLISSEGITGRVLQS